MVRRFGWSWNRSILAFRLLLAGRGVVYILQEGDLRNANHDEPKPGGDGICIIVKPQLIIGDRFSMICIPEVSFNDF